MRKLTLILTACLLLAALCACGASAPAPAGSTPTAAPAQTQTPAPASTPETTQTPAPAQPAQPTAAPETPQPSEAPVNETLELAKTFIGKTTAELFEAIGAPQESDYASSCLGPGDDGNLYYDGFTVYTYRENGVETIRIVE